MASRLYRTGITKTLQFSGTVTLHNCGATDIPEGWRTPNGYISPSGDSSHFSRWSISIRAFFGGEGTISNQQLDVGNERWNTNIIIGTLDKEWNVYSDGVTPNNSPPSDVSLTISCSLDCEEWAVEWYSSLRPASAFDARIEYFLRPIGKVNVTYTSSGGSGNYLADPIVFEDSDRGIHLIEWPKISTDPESSSYGGGIEGDVFLGALPTSNWIYGSANGLAGNFPLNWAGNLLTFTGASKDFKVLGPPLEPYGNVDNYSIPANSFIQDAKLTPIVDIRIYPDYFTGTSVIVPGNGNQNLYGAHLHPVIVFPDLINVGYRNDQEIFIKEGGSTSAFVIDKLPSLQAIDFTNKTWTPSDCTVSITGNQLIAAATGANPKIERNLVNDLLNISTYSPNAEQWFIDNSGALPDWVINWHRGNGGPTLTLDAPGHWSHIRRKLLENSDIFNWSTYRYAHFTGSADQECDALLIIDWFDVELTASDGNIATGSRQISYPIHLTPTTQTIEIDLPGMSDGNGKMVGTDGLQCITHLALTFPAGRTINLQTIVLIEHSRPFIDVHQSEDTAMVSALTDGKHSLFSNANNSPLRLENIEAINDVTNFPNSVWGIVSKVSEQEGSTSYSMTLNQLAAEISLQEGWSATSTIDGFATDLNESFNQPCPATLSSERSFGTWATYPDSDKSIKIRGNIGTKIQGLVYDLDTHLPVSTSIRLEDTSGNVIENTSSDKTGFFQLFPTKGSKVRLKSSPNSDNEVIWPPIFDTISQYEPLLSRTVWYLVMPGKAVTLPSGSGIPYDVDFISNQWVTYTEDGDIKVGRKFGAEKDWTPLDTGIQGDRPWIQHYQHEDESPLYLTYISNGKIFLSINKGHADLPEWTQLAEIADGDHPFLKWDKLAGILYISYWRGGSVYIKRTSNGGKTFIKWLDKTDEKLVRASAAENLYCFDWLHDDPHTIVMPYMENGQIKTLTSLDHGETWS